MSQMPWQVYAAFGVSVLAFIGGMVIFRKKKEPEVKNGGWTFGKGNPLRIFDGPNGKRTRGTVTHETFKVD